MQQLTVKFIALSYRHCSTCFGHYNAHHQEAVKPIFYQLIVNKNTIFYDDRKPEAATAV